MTKKKITGVDDLEVGKCYRQGKGFYFRFVGKDHLGDVVGSWVHIHKDGVHVEQEQEIPWIFDVGKEIKEIAPKKFIKAFDKAIKKITRIGEDLIMDMAADIITAEAESKAKSKLEQS